jgi:hypothetical protein
LLQFILILRVSRNKSGIDEFLGYLMVVVGEMVKDKQVKRCEQGGK